MTPATDTGTATTTRRKRPQILSPAQFIAKLRKDDAKANASSIRLQYERYCRERSLFDDDQVDTLVMTYVIEGLRRDVKDLPSPAEREAQRAQRAAEKQATVETLRQGHERVVEIEATIRILEWVTPYNKKLGACTGAECGRLSRRFGSFFAELEKRLTPSETVSTLGEGVVKALATTHRLIGPRATR